MPLSYKAVLLPLITIALSILFSRSFLSKLAPARINTSVMSSSVNVSSIPSNQAEWIAAIDSLPSAPEKIPSFFFAHGSPALAYQLSSRGGFEAYQGPNGPLASFLKVFGPALLKKYNPRAVVVFSAHWETSSERLGTLRVNPDYQPNICFG